MKNKISSYSLQGLFRLLLMKIRGKKYHVSGSCTMCGDCCRKINLKTSKGWIRSEEHFKKMLEKHHDFKKFEITGKDKQGYLLFTCTWLLPSGQCRDHINRLAICKSYPSTSLMFCGGHVPNDCGFTIEMVTPFHTILEQERQRLQ